MSNVTKKIGSIKFACLSPEEIRKMSAVKVITADTYNDEGRAIDGGVMDPRMGVVEQGMRCRTCKCKVDDCPGHFGSIDLVYPVIHIGYIKDIKMLLECTCCECGRLKLSQEEMNAALARLKAINDMGGDDADRKLFAKSVARKATKKADTKATGSERAAQRCPWCGAVQNDIKLDKPTTFRETIESRNDENVRDKFDTVLAQVLKSVRSDLVHDAVYSVPGSDIIGVDPETVNNIIDRVTDIGSNPMAVREAFTNAVVSNLKDVKVSVVSEALDRIPNSDLIGADQAYVRRMVRSAIAAKLRVVEPKAIRESFYNALLKVPGVSPEAARDAVDRISDADIKDALRKGTTYRDHNLSSKAIRERLENIPDTDLVVLGMDPASFRPEWMVLTVLPVPPVTVRPSITLDSGDRSEDDLTHKLVDILRINQRLRENRDSGSPQLIVEDLQQLLQFHITTYFDNQTAGIPPARHRSGRPLKTLAQRLKGKEGRFRSNLSGKRVNFSSRTVISPDPNLSINEIGIPVAVSRELTVPEVVNARNIEIYKTYIRFGLEPTVERVTEVMNTLEPGTPEYEVCEKALVNLSTGTRYQFGVNNIIRADGRRKRIFANDVETRDSETGTLTIDIKASFLTIGDTVERQLRDGDVVLFNRQPSLHRMSIMCHRVRVMPGKTFRFNLTDCAPYNADFDGDEMNVHALQGVEARSEALILMQVQENILSPRYGGPIIGGIHDHISGSFLLTHGEKRFGRWETMNIMMKLCPSAQPVYKKDKDGSLVYDENGARIEVFNPLVPPEPAGTDDNGEPYWTGKQLFSLALPKDFTIKFKSSIQNNLSSEDPENDGDVVIVNGQLINGTIDESAIGNSKGKILERVARDYGTDAAAEFLRRMTRLALATTMDIGFSTGISDEDLPEDSLRQIEEVCEERIKAVEDLIVSYQEGTLDTSSGGTPLTVFEGKVGQTLGEARKMVGEIAGSYLGMSNSAVIMAKTGARGSMTNLSQMAGLVGQQNIRGSRIVRGYWKRTLSHFARGDLGAYAKGFCSHSYKLGLTPTEFFFHSMGGREGLVDTAVRTARSGYMQRRLVSALEDLKLTSDGAIKNTIGTIVQFKYGEDGIDPAHSVRGAAIDIDDLLVDVLGAEEATKLIQAQADLTASYGERDSDDFDNDFDSDDDGGENEDEEYDNDVEGGDE